MTELFAFAESSPILFAASLWVQYLVVCRIGRAVVILCRGWPPESYNDGDWEQQP